MRSRGGFIQIIILLIIIGSCVDRRTIRSPYDTGYDFSHADLHLVLPDTLREISGLTGIDANMVACVQDENGILFLYDLQKNGIAQEYQFNIDGDYEGITRVGNSMYVLRSDGELFAIEDYRIPGSNVDSYQTGIPADNNEGLCYDSKNNRLLIACKGRIEKGKEGRDLRMIYAFDLVTKKLSEEPVYTFNLEDIRQFAAAHNISFPVREKKNKKQQAEEPIIRFRTSEIGIHPISGELYLLSAADHCLFVFDEQGKVIHIELLEPEVFNKSEGITFFENGDLLISNEAQDMHPTLLRFNYRRI